ncbi:MAG: sugar-transfer associated ATP-grasp domain-containing protein [Gammaproteobacteria bacterium]
MNLFPKNLFSRSFKNNKASVLNMNQRNLDFIYPNNSREHFSLADNKLNTKLLFVDKDIPIAETYQVYSHFYQLRHLQKDLEQYQKFVIKPASGSGGGGILVINGRSDNGYRTISGQHYSLDDIKKHLADILFGIYAFGLNDQALIEEKIEQHPSINTLSPRGLADVRIIMYRNQPVQAMIRLATKHSRGTANLHQGAIGVGVNLVTGVTCEASFHGRAINKHPDTEEALIGHSIPYWQQIIATAKRVAENVPLKYIGVDIAIADQGPVLLEINVRPGIEIQNVNGRGLRQQLQQLSEQSDE